jgi:hypothetical protein
MARNAKKAIAQVQTDSIDGTTSLFTGLPTDVRIHIAQRAYELFTSRGGQAGSDVEDWLQAEKEIMRT